MNSENEKLALHFKYFALIAIMVIIAIATERWSKSQEFTTYLSNAATMTSLFLGIVAIIYSFFSNVGMSQSLGSISAITTEVRDVRNEIGEFVVLTQKAVAASAENTGVVEEISASLSISLTSLHETLSSLAIQNETLKGLVAALPTKDQIESLDIKVADVAKAIGEKPQKTQIIPPQTAISDLAIERFLQRSSLSANLLTYACVLAATKGKLLPIPAVAAAIDWNAPNQMQGYISAMHSFQVCSRKMIEGTDKHYQITNVHPHLLAQSKNYYVKYINENYNHEEKENWLSKLSNLDKLFS